MDPFEILKKFGEYINYNPEQKSFNLLSNQWMLHNAGKTITTICDRFDHSGRMAVLYAKKIYMKTIQNSRVSLSDVLSQPDELASEQKMYNMFNGADVKEIERSYIDSLHQTVLSITGMKELGERDLEKETKVVYNALENVAEQLGKCYKDVYINSNKPVDAVKNISTKIQLFNYMSDCALVLANKAPDGAYLCYINNNGTADGYFAIAIKSNGNLFSVNDRVPEAYIGQHTKSRNGRWTEDHKTFFPYEEVMTFSDYDYKGYASKYNIDESRLNFADLNPQAYIPIILAILCVINDQAGKPLDDKYQVYMNTLAVNNMQHNLESKDLMQLDQTGLIEQTAKILDIHLDPEKIVSGQYNKEYDICSSGYGQKLVHYYGENYKPKIRYLSLKAKNALSDGKTDEPVHAEFVGNVDKMRRQAYYEARIDLAKHVEAEHQRELEEFGGLTKVYEWYSKKMKENTPNLYPILARLYSETTVIGGYNRFVYREDDPEWMKHIRLLGERPFSDERFIFNTPYRTDPDHYYPDYYLCPITGTKASIWILLNPLTDEDIKAFTGGEIVPPLRGWINHRYSEHRISCGNPILDVVDAMDFVEPLGYTENGHIVDFAYYIGFSKRGINRLMKENGLKVKEKKADAST